MTHHQSSWSVGTFAAAAGVNVETIRFYQRRGLLPEPTRPYGQISRYGETDVARVKFVKSAQRLEFSLEESRALRLGEETHCDKARAMAEEKLDDVRAKLRDLRRIESTLRRRLLRRGRNHHLIVDRRPERSVRILSVVIGFINRCRSPKQPPHVTQAPQSTLPRQVERVHRAPTWPVSCDFQ